MRRFTLMILVCLLLSPLAAQGRGEEDMAGESVIAVTIVPEQTFVREVVKDAFSVTVVVPPGSSPETYEPTARQRAELEKAELYFAIGVPSEEAILPLLSKKTKVVHLDEAVRSQYDDLTLGDGRDPHIWLSPRRASVMVLAIADEAGALKRERKEEFRANAEEFSRKIGEVASEIGEIFSTAEKREFIAFHPAFGYFADDFGLKQFALEEEGKEASPRHLAALVDLAREKGLKTIFFQAETDSRQSRAFAEERGGKAVLLHPLSPDYLGSLRKMAVAIREAL